MQRTRRMSFRTSGMRLGYVWRKACCMGVRVGKERTLRIKTGWRCKFTGWLAGGGGGVTSRVMIQAPTRAPLKVAGGHLPLRPPRFPERRLPRHHLFHLARATIRKNVRRRSAQEHAPLPTHPFGQEVCRLLRLVRALDCLSAERGPHRNQGWNDHQLRF
jgi:hypothetical protein